MKNKNPLELLSNTKFKIRRLTKKDKEEKLEDHQDKNIIFKKISHAPSSTTLIIDSEDEETIIKNLQNGIIELPNGKFLIQATKICRESRQDFTNDYLKTETTKQSAENSLNGLNFNALTRNKKKIKLTPFQTREKNSLRKLTIKGQKTEASLFHLTLKSHTQRGSPEYIKKKNFTKDSAQKNNHIDISTASFKSKHPLSESTASSALNSSRQKYMKIKKKISGSLGLGASLNKFLPKKK